MQSVQCLQALPATLRHPFRRHLAAFPAQQSKRRTAATRCRRRQARADLDSGTSLAVTQQCGSFIFTIMGEALWMRSQLPEGTRGRPSLPISIGAAAGFATTLALLQLGGDMAKAGLVLGTATSAGLLLYYGVRIFNTEGDPAEWPGPRAWPAAMSLISLFSVNICFQALRKALDPVVVDNFTALN